MGSQVQCGTCGRDALDAAAASQDVLCRRACGLEQAPEIGCDPAGAFFDETLAHLGELDRCAFHFAASSNISAVRWLFAFGADLRVEDAEGTTLLHTACRTGSLQVVQDLVRRGLQPGVVDRAGWTPLHVASCMGRQEVSRYLLEAGAHPCCRNNRGQTPEDLCSHLSTKELVVSYSLHVAAPAEMADSLSKAEMQNAYSAYGTERLEAGGGYGDESLEASASGLHFEPFFVPRDPLMQECESSEELRELGLHLFDRSPGHGVAFLVATGAVKDYPVEINGFLLRAGADAAQFGEFLCEDCPIAQTLRLEFLNSLPLLGTGAASAMQTAAREMDVPRGLLKADRLAQGVAHFWWRQHSEELAARKADIGIGAGHWLPELQAAGVPGELAGFELHGCLLGPNALGRLMFSAMMLSRWLLEGRSMSLNEWVQLNTGIETGGSDVPVHVQEGIYAAVAEHDALRPDRRGCRPDPSKPATLYPEAVEACSGGSSSSRVSRAVCARGPSCEGWARVRFKGRAQASLRGPRALSWPESSPQALAEMGGVSAAGRSAPFPEGARAAGRPPAPAAPHPAAEAAGAMGAGPGSAQEEEAAWLELRGAVLLLAPSRGAPPFAFVALGSTTELSGADPSTRQLLLVNGVDVRFPSMAVESEWLEMCLLLGDGRFQPLEAPDLALAFDDDVEFSAWEQALRRACGPGAAAERRQAAERGSGGAHAAAALEPRARGFVGGGGFPGEGPPGAVRVPELTPEDAVPLAEVPGCALRDGSPSRSTGEPTEGAS